MRKQFGNVLWRMMVRVGVGVPVSLGGSLGHRSWMHLSSWQRDRDSTSKDVWVRGFKRERLRPASREVWSLLLVFVQVRHRMDTLKAAINLCQEAFLRSADFELKKFWIHAKLSQAVWRTWLDLRLADGLCGVSNASDTSGYASHAP
ncbi:hypothetical protein BU15DRAFT_66879 [Melanogaster broomeanus]|nr:hypothetical protein BU15DRAFT_66879 [Melanogaster broomeanus]